MSSNVYCLTGDQHARAAAFAACLRRVLGPGVPRESSPADTAAWVAGLRRQGLIIADPPDVRYVPSPRAKAAIGDNPAAGWPPRVAKQVGNAVPGALFTLPLYGRDGELEIFITDWSPFPAAAAVAVHRSHPLADPIGNVENRPTGSYVRNPLTGDLLPVWTADWVRPGFGTGVVAVNPAHSTVDLEFARAVGLPIRFALADAVPGTDRATWPEPPVIGRGVGVRTGIADGEPPAVTTRAYLDSLVAAGHARRHTDLMLGALTLGQAPADGADLTPTPAVGVVAAGPLPRRAVLVVAAGGVADLVLLRALHIDLHGTDIEDPEVHVVAAANGPGQPAGPDAVLDLALLGFGRLDENVAVKPAQREQAERFLAAHPSVASQQQGPDVPAGRRAASIVSRVAAGQTAPAFADLYKLQRDIRKQPDAVGAGDRHGYFAAAYALAGLQPPAGYPLTGTMEALLGG